MKKFLIEFEINRFDSKNQLIKHYNIKTVNDLEELAKDYNCLVPISPNQCNYYFKKEEMIFPIESYLKSKFEKLFLIILRIGMQNSERIEFYFVKKDEIL